MKEKKRKIRSLEATRQRAGYWFVLPWVIGLLMFFVLPLFSSIRYSFSDVRIEPGEVVTEWVGLKNYNGAINEDPNYIDQLGESVSYVLYAVPLVVAFSLLIALLLNQNFRGRTFFRALFFSPIIFTASPVMSILEGDVVQMPFFTQGAEDTANFTQIFEQMNLPASVMSVISFMLWFSLQVMQHAALPTVLFIAGLQEVPGTLYEVSKIEGANKWEEFWMITVPSLRHIISLVLIYSMIDMFAQSHNTLITRVEGMIGNQEFSSSSAMLWFYFLIVIFVMGTVYALYQRYCMKKWE